MNVLFVLSQTTVTGAETYALSLASALKELGHSLIFVSDTLRSPGGFKYIPLPIHQGNESLLGRARNILSLREIIEREGVDLIHAHSRAANLVSAAAARSLRSRRVPLVVTVHGRWRNHFAFRRLPCLGERTIAVCPALKRYLVEEIGRPEAGIRMIPNGIDTQAFSPGRPRPGAEPTLLMVGRFTGQKGEAARHLMRSVFPEVLGKMAEVSITIFGTSPGEQDRRLAEELNRGCGRHAVTLLDREDDLPGLYRNATAVIGSGRVALEAMSCGRPVIAIGESSAPGLVTPSGFDKAFDSNFGDCGEWDLFKGQKHLAGDIHNAFRNKSLSASLADWGRNTALSLFDSRKIAFQIDVLYRELAVEAR